MLKVIVIPTYNERDNIKKIISEVFGLGIDDLKILVVDDNSPDGTGDLIEDLKKNNPRIETIHRSQKMGLGPAYVAGFKKALAMGADYIFEMDADFSHQPKYLLDFVRCLGSADLIIGSRYIAHGGIENWNWIRRAVSYFGNFYARVILNMPTRDLTGGFKCYSRKVLESVDLDGLSSSGYVFQIETTYRVYQKGFTIKEIPIIFSERRIGKSKFNIHIIWESFFKVLWLRLKK